MIFMWASWTLYSYYKKGKHRSHGHSHSNKSSDILFPDNTVLIILSYIAMFVYVLSIFCYLILLEYPKRY